MSEAIRRNLSNPSFQMMGMPSGPAGIDFTLKQMSALTKEGKRDISVRITAAELCRNLPQKDFFGEILSCFAFVQDNIRYTRDIRDVETLHTAKRILEQEYGDCDDKCILLASMLESIGHPTRFVAVGFQPGEYSHVFVDTVYGPDQIGNNGKRQKSWLSLDATEKKPIGWRPPNIVSIKTQYN